MAFWLASRSAGVFVYSSLMKFNFIIDPVIKMFNGLKFL
jgi:hypothetical protein